MILFLAKRDDLHVDPVLLKCKEHGANCFRLDPEDEWFENSKLTLQQGKNRGFLETPSRKLDLNHVTSVFCRDFSFAECKDEVEIEHHIGYSESKAALKSMFLMLDSSYWMNSPWVEEKIDNKAFQSIKASQAGLNVPEFIITNQQAQAIEFHRLYKGEVVIKQLSDICMEHQQQEKVYSLYTQKVNESDLNDLEGYPCFLQRHIKKSFDIRVVYVAGSLFPYKIHSQENHESRIDFRVIKDLNTERFQLPNYIEQNLLKLTSNLGLEFCCIDLILDQDNTYWFLEANVQGNWLWHEEESYPIVNRIAKMLSRTV